MAKYFLLSWTNRKNMSKCNELQNQVHANERERERWTETAWESECRSQEMEGWRDIECVWINVCPCVRVCVCACVLKRERERERESGPKLCGTTETLRRWKLNSQAVKVKRVQFVFVTWWCLCLIWLRFSLSLSLTHTHTLSLSLIYTVSRHRGCEQRKI